MMDWKPHNPAGERRVMIEAWLLGCLIAISAMLSLIS